MALLDVFKRSKKTQSEANSLFGQTVLGNTVLRNAGSPNAYQQMLYVTTSATTEAGRSIDMSLLSRNSTIMSCVGVKARALSQLPIQILAANPDGQLVDACTDESIGQRDKVKAKQIASLISNPNNFQSQYEFWYQLTMWLELAGESFVAFWRKDQANSQQSPLEMYVLDSTLITAQISPTRYPMYHISSPTFGYAKGDSLSSHQIMHITESPWQGSAGFNKGTLAVELVALDQDIDLYANFVMQNGAKPSGLFITDQVIPDGKYKEIAARIKEAWSQLTGSKQSDASKPGQGMLLDQGMKYEPLSMLTLQDADAAALKDQTMKRICALFGVPPQLIGLSEGKFNNTQTLLDEFYKSTMSPMLTNLEQKLKASLLAGYPNLYVKFKTQDFLKGAPLDQMNYSVAGVNAGILTPNEARAHLGLPELADTIASKLVAKNSNTDTAISGTSSQDTGGGGNSGSVGKTGRAGSA